MATLGALLDRGADPGALDAHGCSALHLAAAAGEAAAVRALLARGFAAAGPACASATTGPGGSAGERLDAVGWAAAFGHREAAEVLAGAAGVGAPAVRAAALTAAHRRHAPVAEALLDDLAGRPGALGPAERGDLLAAGVEAGLVPFVERLLRAGGGEPGGNQPVADALVLGAAARGDGPMVGALVAGGASAVAAAANGATVYELLRRAGGAPGDDVDDLREATAARLAETPRARWDAAAAAAWVCAVARRCALAPVFRAERVDGALLFGGEGEGEGEGGGHPAVLTEAAVADDGRLLRWAGAAAAARPALLGALVAAAGLDVEAAVCAAAGERDAAAVVRLSAARAVDLHHFCRGLKRSVGDVLRDYPAAWAEAKARRLAAIESAGPLEGWSAVDVGDFLLLHGHHGMRQVFTSIGLDGAGLAVALDAAQAEDPAGDLGASVHSDASWPGRSSSARRTWATRSSVSSTTASCTA